MRKLMSLGLLQLQAPAPLDAGWQLFYGKVSRQWVLYRPEGGPPLAKNDEIGPDEIDRVTRWANRMIRSRFYFPIPSDM
jgi:hypothetical protein